MQTLIKHTEIIGTLKQNKIYLNFIKDCNLQDLINCCKKIENNSISSKIYADNLAIQRELITDDSFINYLIAMIKNDIDLERLESLCSTLHENKDKISNYSLDILLQVLKNKNITTVIFYDYLKYFSNNIKTRKDQDIVVNNLSYFHSQSEITMSDLTKKERDLFFLEVMSDQNLIPINNIKEVCEILVKDNELKNIILFLYSHNLSLQLNLNNYHLIHGNSNIIFQYIQKLVEILDNENMYQLLLRWIENDANAYDLKFLSNNLKGLKRNEIDKIFCNRSAYINFIFGNKLKDFPMEKIHENAEPLLIYAISHNKKRFLQLIQENPKTFTYMFQYSLLFNKDFYKKYINLNTLTLKDLKKLDKMPAINSNLKYLNERNYTFGEIALLYNAYQQYLTLYNYLLDLKIDKRMLIMKQLLKRNLLLDIYDVETLQRLAQLLKKQNLYRWIEKDFAHIKGLKPMDSIKILSNYEKIKRFIPQIQNETELLYVLRNIDEVQKYNDLDTIKENIEEIDVFWSELITKMNFTSEFIENNKKSIKHFLLKNGAELALRYCRSNSRNNLDSFKKIVKAELMGQFSKLKYFKDDLYKEIDFDLTNKQISEWTSNNIVVTDGDIEVKEYDDFYSTMILGEYPQRTCLSYNGGAYNHCLIACFDSNKKILYAKINGKIVARAMVRLTKGSYKNSTEGRHNLSFVDLEDIKSSKDNSHNKKEYLTIFLERPYISGISIEEENKVKKMFISLLEKKALLMNAQLVLSSDYIDVVDKKYVRTKYYMYISNSKAGAQYLDSLNGENGVTEEGLYKSNVFLIYQR